MAKTLHPNLAIFSDPEHAATYADGPATFMPGFHAVHQMADVLVREHTARNAHVLVHGAGGGLELEAFARGNPDWTFVGVDPAKPMLDAARTRLGDLNKRIALFHGFIDSAPEGPFDAATSLLTLHFLNAVDRQKTVSQIVRRLKPGAPFVTAYCSFPQHPRARSAWLARHKAFTMASGVDEEIAEQGRQAIAEDLYTLDPETDERILCDAGLSDVTMFYSAFTWRGWVGRAP